MVGRDDVANASISLFSSAGIGDLGIEYGCEIPVILSAELNEKRADLISNNYPRGIVIKGDIVKTKTKIISSAKKILGKKRPLLVTLSPPCQGMSTNGAGKISAQVKKGKRPKYDERNKLLIPGLQIVKTLQPEYFLIENVPNMKNTVVMWKKKKPRKLVDLIPTTVGKGYSIVSFVQDFTKYGVPHNRKRLITIGKRTNQSPSTIEVLNSPPKWFDSGSIDDTVSVRNAIGTIYRTRKKDPTHLHLMPKMNVRHKEWIRHIPKNSGNTAHYNPCENNKCGHIDDFRVVVCTKCGENLPRPFVENDGVRRAIKGYKTSYRRMLPNVPANTITMNSGVVSSDVKVHYNQDRVLTLLEILILSTVYEIPNKKFNKTYEWNGKYSFSELMDKSDYLLQKNIIRQALGESIPPLAMQRMVNSLINDWP
jgi:DNA (cytosine-5)-methyltransferase 1